MNFIFISEVSRKNLRLSSIEILNNVLLKRKEVFVVGLDQLSLFTCLSSEKITYLKKTILHIMSTSVRLYAPSLRWFPSF